MKIGISVNDLVPSQLSYYLMLIRFCYYVKLPLYFELDIILFFEF